jgi:hypothetical protein
VPGQRRPAVRLPAACPRGVGLPSYRAPHLVAAPPLDAHHAKKRPTVARHPAPLGS